ncbi:MAG: thioredoxin family protein [Pirellulaceae bacterium]|nr:thioredoxin family protein [Pirellulaceae bacterium]
MICLRYLLRPLTIVLSACVVAALPADTLTTGTWKTDADQAWQSAQQDQRLMLLFITTQNCLYCRKMEHDTFASQKVAWDIQQNCVPVTVAAEKNEALVKRFRVNTYPTTVIISPKSGVVDYIVGYLGPDEFSRRLAAATQRSQTAAAGRRRATR